MNKVSWLVKVAHLEFGSDWTEGMSTPDLVRKYDASLSTLHKARKRLGLAPRRRGPKSDPRPRPLTSRDRTIVRLRKKGKSYREIEPLVGVSYERVRQILHEIGRSDLCQVAGRPIGEI